MVNFISLETSGTRDWWFENKFEIEIIIKKANHSQCSVDNTCLALMICICCDPIKITT